MIKTFIANYPSSIQTINNLCTQLKSVAHLNPHPLIIEATPTPITQPFISSQAFVYSQLQQSSPTMPKNNNVNNTLQNYFNASENLIIDTTDYPAYYTAFDLKDTVPI